MSELEKFWFGVVTLLALGFALYTAATEAKAYTIDSARLITVEGLTLQKGYTVKSYDEKFSIPINPGAYAVPVKVKIETVAVSSPLPVDKKAVSGVYAYDVQTGKKGIMDQPIVLSFDYDAVARAGDDWSIYYFDKNRNAWESLPTIVNTTQRRAMTKTVFPSAEVVILAASDLEEFTAKSAIVMDADGKILFQKNADEARPIASLTKLLTASVFVRNNPGWDVKITMKESDNVGGAAMNVKNGDVVTVRDLFNAMLVGSKNNAARALMRSTGMTDAKFIAEMNALSKKWGLTKTKVYEPTGLDERNVSSAREMALLSQLAFKNADIMKASTREWYQASYKRGPEVKSEWIKNTNKLLTRDLYVTGSKTGYTTEAGYNLVTRAKNKKHELTVIVMGAKISMNYEEVYTLMKRYL